MIALVVLILLDIAVHLPCISAIVGFEQNALDLFNIKSLSVACPTH